MRGEMRRMWEDGDENRRWINEDACEDEDDDDDNGHENEEEYGEWMEGVEDDELQQKKLSSKV